MVFVKIKQLVNPFNYCLTHGKQTVSISNEMAVKTSDDIQQRGFNAFQAQCFPWIEEHNEHVFFKVEWENVYSVTIWGMKTLPANRCNRDLANQEGNCYEHSQWDSTVQAS